MLRFAVLGMAAITLTGACTDGSPSACEQMRVELEPLSPIESERAWQDIGDLQTDVTRALQLRADIADRCH